MAEKKIKNGRCRTGQRRKVCLAAFLFTCGQVLCAERAISPPALQSSRIVSVGEIEQMCRFSAAPSCDIRIDTSWITTLRERVQLSRSLSFHFTGSGSWQIDGETLDLVGSTVDAPQDHQVFGGSGHIEGLRSARPEWFARPVEGVYPASALALAFQAIDRTGTLLLAEHTYLSPFFDPYNTNTCTGNTVLIDQRLTILGSRRPMPDSDSAPTRLINGTIIRGEICSTGELHATNLGVDEGPYTVAHDFRGRAAYGIQVIKLGVLGSVQNTDLEHLSVLTMGLKDQHSVIVEGQKHTILKDLWIWTLGGAHGLVVKSLESVVDNIHCTGAFSDCLILKSDYDTDHAGDASGSVLNNVFIHSLQHPGDTAGVQLEGKWDSLRHVTLSNIHETGLNYGIVGNDSLLHGLSDVKITNWTATGMRGPCLRIHGGRNIEITHFECLLDSSGADPNPGPAIILNSGGVSLRDGLIACDGSGCSNPMLDGIVDMGRRTHLEQIQGMNLGGFLVRTSPHRGGTRLDSVAIRDMGDRVANVYFAPPEPWFHRMQNWVTSLKPILRILWEKTKTVWKFR